MGMSRKDVKAIIGEDVVTEEMVDKILGLHSADIGGFKGKISELEETLDEYKAKEAQWQEQQQANMSDQEKLEAAIAKAEKREADYAKQISKLEVSKVFVNSGLSEEQYTPLLDTVVTGDAETSKAKAAQIVDLMTAQIEAAKKAAQKDMLKATPKPPTGGTNSINNKDDFLKLGYKEQLEFKQNNPEAFEALMKG